MSRIYWEEDNDWLNEEGEDILVHRSEVLALGTTILEAFVEQGATNWKVGILARPEEGFDEELDYENLKTNEVADTAHARRLALQMAWKWIKRKTRVLETEMHG